MEARIGNDNNFERCENLWLFQVRLDNYIDPNFAEVSAPQENIAKITPKIRIICVHLLPSLN